MTKDNEIQFCFGALNRYDTIAKETNTNGVNTEYVAILWRRRLREINQKRLLALSKRKVSKKAVQS